MNNWFCVEQYSRSMHNILQSSNIISLYTQYDKNNWKVGSTFINLVFNSNENALYNGRLLLHTQLMVNVHTS